MKLLFSLCHQLAQPPPPREFAYGLLVLGQAGLCGGDGGCGEGVVPVVVGVVSSSLSNECVG